MASPSRCSATGARHAPARTSPTRWRARCGRSRGGAVGEVYNIGGGERIELLDVIRILGEAIGIEPVVAFGPNRPWRPAPYGRGHQQSRGGVRVAPGWAPADGLRAQIDWHRALRERGR